MRFPAIKLPGPAIYARDLLVFPAHLENCKTGQLMFHIRCSSLSAAVLELWLGIPSFPVLFDLIMVRRSKDTHRLLLKVLHDFRPELAAPHDSN